MDRQPASSFRQLASDCLVGQPRLEIPAPGYRASLAITRAADQAQAAAAPRGGRNGGACTRVKSLPRVADAEGPRARVVIALLSRPARGPLPRPRQPVVPAL